MKTVLNYIGGEHVPSRSEHCASVTPKEQPEKRRTYGVYNEVRALRRSVTVLTEGAS